MVDLESRLTCIVLLALIEDHADLVGGSLAEDQPQGPFWCCDVGKDPLGDGLRRRPAARGPRLTWPWHDGGSKESFAQLVIRGNWWLL